MIHVELPGEDGPFFVNPFAVTAIKPYHTGGSLVWVASRIILRSTAPASTVSDLLREAVTAWGAFSAGFASGLTADSTGTFVDAAFERWAGEPVIPSTAA